MEEIFGRGSIQTATLDACTSACIFDVSQPCGSRSAELESLLRRVDTLSRPCLQQRVYKEDPLVIEKSSLMALDTMLGGVRK
jgi:hypothetical protein